MSCRISTKPLEPTTTTNESHKLLGFTPSLFGFASVIAACIAWVSIYVVFNQGPDGPLNNVIFDAVAIRLPWFVGLACGLLGVGLGIRHKAWLGISAGAVGLALTVFGARFVMRS